MMMTKNEVINKINNINILEYSCKGGVSKFNKEYPNLLKYINKYTTNIHSYSNNKKLPAKLLFLSKYGGNINSIIYDGNIMIYDPQIKDFKIANINSAKKQWDKCKNELNKINDYYTENITRNKLKNTYKKFWGKSGNRKLINYDSKLYLSLYYHTKEFDDLNKNLNKLSFRLFFFVHKINIKCDIHNTLKHWKMLNGEIKIICSKCEPKYPSKEWFKKTYGDEWKNKINKRKRKLKRIKTNSKKWYLKKYGEEIGEEKYIKSVEKKINNLVNLKANRYSKISQNLFWSVYDKLENKENIYFFELNQEYVIKIPQKFKYNKTIMVVDFIQNNKIIEYNGKYWHNKNDDKIRYNILKSLGYEIFVVDSDEYNRNYRNENIITDCVKFLTC